MDKLKYLVLIAGLCQLATLVFASAGDVNNDGQFDIRDAQEARKRHQLGPLPAPAQSAADVAPIINGISSPDGIVNSADDLILWRGVTGRLSDDVDVDGIDSAREAREGLSPFASDTDGNGVEDADEDRDGDGLTSWEEQALGTAGHLAGSSLSRSDDLTYSVDIALTRFAPGFGKRVIIDETHSNSLMRTVGLQAFVELLETDGYIVSSLTEPFITTVVDGETVCIDDQSEECGWYRQLYANDILVIANPQDPISEAEAAAIVEFGSFNFTASDSFAAVLLVVDQSGGSDHLLDYLGLSMSESRVSQLQANCPSGISNCPNAWNRFSIADDTLYYSHSITLGRAGFDESISEVSGFFGYAFSADSPNLAPSLNSVIPFLTFDDNSIMRQQGGEVPADGWSPMYLFTYRSLNPNHNPLQDTFGRIAVLGDPALISAYSDESQTTGLTAVDRQQNEQLVQNLMNWLSYDIEAPAGQAGERPYVSDITTPEYPLTDGPRVKVDRTHKNFHDLQNRYYAFGKILSDDGYQVGNFDQAYSSDCDSGSCAFLTELASTDVLVIPNIGDMDYAISEQEATAIKGWVEQGNSLFVIFDHDSYNKPVELLLNELGLDLWDENTNARYSHPQCSPDCSGLNIEFHASPGPGEPRLLPHPIQSGRFVSEAVNSVQMNTGNPFSVALPQMSNAHYEALTEFPSGATMASLPADNLVFGAAIELGQGRVFVAGEASAFSSQYSTTTYVDDGVRVSEPPTGLMGISVNADNQQYLRNIMNWLTWHMDLAEDVDNDGYLTWDERGMSSSPVDPLSPGTASNDLSYAPVLSNPAATSKTVLIDASHNNSLSMIDELAPLVALLEADGYTVTEFTETFNGIVEIPALCDETVDPGKCGWYETLVDADLFIIPEPKGMSADEASELINYYGAHFGSLLLILEEADSGAELKNQLGIAASASRVIQQSEACSAQFNGRCPLGWKTFSGPDNGLVPHLITQGRPDQNELISEVTGFFGRAFTLADNLQSYQPLLSFDQRSSFIDGDQIVSADGSHLALAMDFNDLPSTVGRAVILGDNGLVTATAETSARYAQGLSATSADSNQQFLLNTVHWLLGDLTTAGGLDFNPVVSNPTYPLASGPRIRVDSTHSNYHLLNGKYAGFRSLLAADGYRLEDFNQAYTPACETDMACPFRQLLSTTDILTIATMESDVAMSVEEAQLIRSWVEAGGSLLLVFDHPPRKLPSEVLLNELGMAFPQDPGFYRPAANAPSWCDPPLDLRGFIQTDCNVNLGFHTNGGPGDPLLSSHATVTGQSPGEEVTFVRTFHGAEFTVATNTPANAVYHPIMSFPAGSQFYKRELTYSADIDGLIYDTTVVPADNLMLGAAVELGAGKVFVSGEAAALTAQFAPGKSERWGMNSVVGNQQFLLNIIHWLDTVIETNL